MTVLSPDVMFSVCMYARFQASSRESHLKATKRILRYMKHTQNVGLWYPKGAKFELVCYSDSDYVGCKVERKRAPRAHVNCWEDHLFYGHQRSRIVLHYQSPKLNTYPPVVVHKYFR